MIPVAYRLKQAALFMGDLLVFELALVPALVLRYGTLSADTLARHIAPFGLISLLWCTTFYINHLYSLQPRPPLRLLRAYLESMVMNFGIAIAVFYLLPFGIEPRTNLFFHFLLSLLLGYAWRVTYYRYVIERLKPIPFLYIGDAHTVTSTQELLRENRFAYTLSHVFLPQEASLPSTASSLIRLTKTSDVVQAIQQGKIRGLLLDQKGSLDVSLREITHHALFASLPILDLIELEEASEGRVPLRGLSDTWFLLHLQEANKAFYDQLKRALDLLSALPFGLAALLIAPFIWLSNLVLSPGPLLYHQERVGLRGTTFQLWKFRTMHVDAEAHGPQFSGGADRDTRITKLGRWLRKLRIDELPQIWNVLQGDLSFIGPRPERPEFVAPLLAQEPFYALRHLTKPGLTGWAQVSYLKPNQTNNDNLEKLQYDLYYLKHRSLMLDGLILLRTIGIVLRRQGV